MSNNLYISKYIRCDNTSFIVLGFTEIGDKGEVIGYTTSVDAEWFFNTVQRLKDSPSGYVLREEIYE